MNKPLRLPNQFEQNTHSPNSAPRRPGSSPMPLVLLVAFLLVAGIAGVYFMMRAPIDALLSENAFVRGQLEILREQQVAAPASTPTITSTPEPICDSYAGEIGALQDLVTQGKFALATELANVHLNNRKLPPCPEAKQALAEMGYSAALNDLFSSRELDGHTALLRWEDAEAKADANNVPFAKRWPPLTIVSQAYNAGFWELSRAAFRQAWSGGSVDRTDSKSLRLYYAILRNWGYALASRTDQQARREGVTLLRTADEVRRAYGLTDGEAQQDLIHFLGEDMKQWPAADAKDPVLATALGKGDK